MDDDDVRRDDLTLLQQREAEFNDVLKEKPRAGDFFVAVSEGKSPVAMLVEAMGTDAVKDYLNSEDNAKELAEAQQKYLDEVKKGETAPVTTAGTASFVYYLMQDCADISESAKLGELWYYDGTSWKEYSGELLG